MKKEIQDSINVYCMNHYNHAMRELQKEQPNGKRLRSCTAWVFETTHYYILRSYNTYIAVIRKETDALWDVLRVVYGYTSTSAQHVAKFNHDYCRGYYGCTERHTAR